MFLDRGVTLGTLLERAATVHGDRQLVEEADGGLILTFREGADLVARCAAAIQAQISRGDRVVIATEHAYGLFLLPPPPAPPRAAPAPVDPNQQHDETHPAHTDSA